MITYGHGLPILDHPWPEVAADSRGAHDLPYSICASSVSLHAHRSQGPPA